MANVAMTTEWVAHELIWILQNRWKTSHAIARDYDRDFNTHPLVKAVRAARAEALRAERASSRRDLRYLDYLTTPGAVLDIETGPVGQVVSVRVPPRYRKTT